MDVTESFSAVLRAETREPHDRANASPFVAALLSGALNRDGYTELVVQHHFIYTALEEAGDALRDDPVAGPFVLDELRRVPALAEDLRFLIGPQWRNRIAPNESTAGYCARIREVARDWPGGFVAHHYTRYLGDLAGGQIVRKQLSRFHGITDAGARFYAFDAIDSPPQFRKRYRALLDAAPFDADERRRVLAEVGRAFELNIAVLAELAAGMDRYLVA